MVVVRGEEVMVVREDMGCTLTPTGLLVSCDHSHALYSSPKQLLKNTKGSSVVFLHTAVTNTLCHTPEGREGGGRGGERRGEKEY